MVADVQARDDIWRRGCSISSGRGSGSKRIEHSMSAGGGRGVAECGGARTAAAGGCYQHGELHWSAAALATVGVFFEPDGLIINATQRACCTTAGLLRSRRGSRLFCCHQLLQRSLSALSALCTLYGA